MTKGRLTGVGVGPGDPELCSVFRGLGFDIESGPEDQGK